MRRALVAILIAAGAHAACGFNASLPMDDKGGLTVRLESALSAYPPWGFAPLRVTLANNTDARRTVHMTFVSAASARFDQQVRSGRRFEVEPNRERSFDVLVPLLTLPAIPHAFPNLHLEALSDRGERRTETWQEPYRGYSTRGSTAHLVLSESIGMANLEAIRKEADTAGWNLSAAMADLAKLTADPAGWLGTDWLLLTTDEWQALPELPRRAIVTWMKSGGGLLLRLKGSEAPGGELPSEGRHGFGLCRWIRADDTGLRSILLNLVSRPGFANDAGEGYDRLGAWNLLKLIPPLKIPVLLLTLFVIVYAVVVGPANVILASRKKAHARLLWTTPLLAIGASALLAALILLRDGFGGQGERLTCVWLDDAAHQSIVWQEQVSRTGLLIDRSIPVREPLFIGDIRIGGFLGVRNRRFERSDDRWTGDWFASRSVRGQLLHAVRPTRARFEIEERPDGPPVLISSLEHPVEGLFYRDQKGGYWTARSVKPGVPAKLAPSTEKDHQAAWSEGRKLAGPRLAGFFDLPLSPGMVHAFGGGDSAALPSLPAIRWRQAGFFLIGTARPSGRGIAP